MKNQEIPQCEQQPQFCIFCSQKQQTQTVTLFQMMNQALITKHSSQINNHIMVPINIILKQEQPHTTAQLYDYIIYKQFNYIDQTKQQLRRQYKVSEWPQKIQSLTQYYKFHKDIPHVISIQIQKIMSKFYNKKRQYNYKQIKKILKQQEGVSISSINQSLIQNSCTIVQKSKYSDMLNTLKLYQQQTNNYNQGNHQHNNDNPENSDSNLLRNICNDIDKKLDKVKLQGNEFKGVFNNDHKNFDKFIKNIEKKRKNTPKFNIIDQYLKNKYHNSSYNYKETLDHYYNFLKINLNKNESDLLFNKYNQTKIKTKTVSKQKKQYEESKNKDKKKIQSQSAISKQHNTRQSNTINHKTSHTNNTNNPSSKQKQIKYQKSTLITKIQTINSQRNQPLSKIYQPQQPQILLKFPKKFEKYKKDKIKSKSLKKQKKISQCHQNYHLKDVCKDKQINKCNEKQQYKIKSQEKNKNNKWNKQIMSTPNIHKIKQQIQTKNPENFFNKHINIRTISSTKLKSQANHDDKNTNPTRPISLRQSVALYKNNQHWQKTPFTKYSSSQINKQKLKGLSVKDLLKKKLDTFQK